MYENGNKPEFGKKEDSTQIVLTEDRSHTPTAEKNQASHKPLCSNRNDRNDRNDQSEAADFSIAELEVLPPSPSPSFSPAFVSDFDPSRLDRPQNRAGNGKNGDLEQRRATIKPTSLNFSLPQARATALANVRDEAEVESEGENECANDVDSAVKPNFLSKSMVLSAKKGIAF